MRLISSLLETLQGIRACSSRKQHSAHQSVDELFPGTVIGANVLVARFYGAKAEEDVSDTVHTAMLLSVFSGIILTVIGCIGARQILIWMQTPEDVLPLATTYLRIYFIGMTSMMVYNFGSASCVRSEIRNDHFTTCRRQVLSILD